MEKYYTQLLGKHLVVRFMEGTEARILYGYLEGFDDTFVVLRTVKGTRYIARTFVRDLQEVAPLQGGQE